jgi:hypothetical protein
MSSIMKRLFSGALALLFAFAGTAFGQGVTTSALSGFVRDTSGKPVANVNVTTVHVPTNTTYTAETNETGHFSVTGIPVGGPYSIAVNDKAYSMTPLSGVQTQLGETTDVLLVAAPRSGEVVQMEKFEVKGSVADLDAAAAGSGTVLSTRRIQAQPTVNRSFADLMKTNPFVTLRSGEQATALGANSRMNSILLDGAKINDSFGLNSSGLFALRNPFSLDAVEQVSIQLTPYDVRQSGFTGLLMNVVSKSGTNDFHGSGYFLFTDANWQGKDITGTSKDVRQPLKERTYGFTLGGPIWKDHVFFFVNWEKFFQDRSPTVPQFTPDAAFLSAVQARIAALPGKPDLGAFGGLPTNRLSDSKKLIKLDWNIVRGHRLSLRYSETIGNQPNTGSLNASSFSQPATITGQPTSFPNTITALSSNFFTIPSKEKVWAGQLHSNWTSDLKTQFQFSQTKQNGLRETPSIFPEVRIFNVPVANSTVNSGDALRFGTEISSMGNGIITKTQTYGGSADYNWRTYTFTLGGDHEKSEYTNYFRQGSYGVFDYNNLADFQADLPFGFQRAVVQTGLPIADVSAFTQTGAFAQAKWTPNSRFNATLGLRIDYLGAPIAVPYNAGFQSAFGITNAGTMDGTSIPQPRLSMNYALDEERMTQVRGGIGVFMGRNPWVWVSNSYGNFGLGRFAVTRTTTAGTASVSVPTLAQYLGGTFAETDPAFKFDPAAPIGSTTSAPPAATQVINLMKPGLKLPTYQRANLAIDRKLPFLNAVASIEYIDTRYLSALFVQNLNLAPASVGVDGRQIFAGSASTAPRVAGYGNVIMTRNVHAGASQAVGISLERAMKDGWAYTLAYTHTHATEAQTLNSSTANSNWQFNAVFNMGNVEVARSDYGADNRVQASISKEFRFAKSFLTTVSLYYEGRTGMPYSYVYSNDLNKDGLNANDLIAVPSSLNDPRFDFSGLTAAQQTAYMDYIQSSGLVAFAGSHTVRNAFSTPWQNRLDLRVVQEIPGPNIRFARNAKFEVFADFLNFGYWLNDSLFNSIDLLNQTPSNGGQVRSLGSATYGTDGRIKPSFVDGSTTVLSLNANNQLTFGTDVPKEVTTSSSVIRATNGESRWRIQAGVRMRF